MTTTIVAPRPRKRHARINVFACGCRLDGRLLPVPESDGDDTAYSVSRWAEPCYFYTGALCEGTAAWRLTPKGERYLARLRRRQDAIG